jgi:hypothetical protein
MPYACRWYVNSIVRQMLFPKANKPCIDDRAALQKIYVSRAELGLEHGLGLNWNSQLPLEVRIYILARI